MEFLFAAIWTLLLGISTLVIFVVFCHKREKSKYLDLNLTSLDVLNLIKCGKIIPIASPNQWSLDSFQHGLRIWGKDIVLPDHAEKYQVAASFTRVKGSAQVVVGSILDTSSFGDWDSSVVQVQQISSSRNNRDLSQKSKGSIIIPVRQDTIALQSSDSSSYALQLINSLSKQFKGDSLLRKTWTIERYWHKEDSGCCWILEMNEELGQWWFYLVRPVDGWFEIDQCMLTLITHSYPLNYSRVAVRLAALENWLTYRKIQCIPLNNITLPLKEDDAVNGDNKHHDVKQQEQTLPIIPKGKSEPNFIKKMKSLIDEKREWYEERKRKHSRSPNITGINQACAILNEPIAKATSTDIYNNNDNASEPTLGKKELVKQFRVDGNVCDESCVKTVHGNNDGENEESQEPIELISEEERKKISHRIVANQVAADIMAQNLSVSEIDISKSLEEQAEITGGWVFCGLEKDIVILRKIFEDGTPLQSYLGKGLIPASPSVVFEAIRNPRTRFTYDDSLKKIDVIHDFGDGMKVVYMYHEVAQVFKKECRDFCVLQSERIEGGTYILCLCSVDWPDCLPTEDITRGQFLSTGWLFEPAERKGKEYTMVTYIVQMDLGPSKSSTGYLIEELAAKQPLAISYLREYLAPTRVVHRHHSTGHMNLPSPVGKLADKRRSTPDAVPLQD